MNISYNWLKEYLDLDLQPSEVTDALTSIGLETGSVEEVQPIKGGLEGIVIGQVLTCEGHPNSDHLHITTVNVGDQEPLQIVCGASNVAAGQKVVVATVGTTLYQGYEKFVIKKSKIRGEESYGMICAEDEIGVGVSHEGIIVLPADATVGMLAKDYYCIESDYILEVDITPNRIDGASHFGVARDLAAYLKQAGKPAQLKKPSVDSFQVNDPVAPIVVKVDHAEACIRYSGVTIEDVQVKESPDWLKNRLLLIGLRPINNIVDITNFILHEMGQPLHAFDAKKIQGNQVVVRSLPNGTKFVTLDGVERSLTDLDLMICDTEKPMCIAGVFGGLDSGVTEQTTSIFLESACFHSAWVRKTARRFGLNTDASFRFERGLDPNQTIYALKRAALMIQEIAGGRIVGDIQDVYPLEVDPYPVDITYAKINQTIGKEIPVSTVKSILESLEIRIVSEKPEGLLLHVPVYRFDVRRDVDVIEEILRIYGYNQVGDSEYVQSTLSHQTKADRSYQLENLISEQLVGGGFHEIMNNSLTRSSLYEGLTTYPSEYTAMLLNPLSTDLNGMRQTLLFGGLQSVAFNLNHKNKRIRFFEFGNCYSFHPEKGVYEDALVQYKENYRLGIWCCGSSKEGNWIAKEESSSVFELKAHIESLLNRLGLSGSKVVWEKIVENDIYQNGLQLIARSGKSLGSLGIVKRYLLQTMDIEEEVYYAELDWTALMKEVNKVQVLYSEISKYPAVKRDLALLLDLSVTFDAIEKIAFEAERKLLNRVTLFDVYEGKNLPAGKKSYAVSFYLQDEDKTLNDKQISAIMKKIQGALEQKLDAQLRG